MRCKEGNHGGEVLFCIRCLVDCTDVNCDCNGEHRTALELWKEIEALEKEQERILSKVIGGSDDSKTV